MFLSGWYLSPGFAGSLICVASRVRTIWGSIHMTTSYPRAKGQPDYVSHSSSENLGEIDYHVTPTDSLESIVLEPWGMIIDVERNDICVIRQSNQRVSELPSFRESEGGKYLTFDAFSCPGTTFAVLLNGERVYDSEGNPVPGGGSVLRDVIQENIPAVPPDEKVQ